MNHKASRYMEGYLRGEHEATERLKREIKAWSREWKQDPSVKGQRDDWARAVRKVLNALEGEMLS